MAEATRLWPARSRLSDGICGDANHSSDSDHNDPDHDGFCEAFDLTHDPGHGCDAHVLVRAAVARRDPRIKYAISQGQIASSYSVGTIPAWTWRTYSGPNRHDRHAHVSTTDAYRDDTSVWWEPLFIPPAPQPPPPTLGTPMEVDVLIQPVKIEMPLDKDGRGNVTVDYPIDRIVGFLPHSEVRPNVDNRYDPVPNAVHFTPEGERTVIVAQGGNPLGRFHLWLRVAA